MHDPLVVAFEIKVPIPRVYLSRKHYQEGRGPSFDTGITRRRRTNAENLGEPVYPWWRPTGYEVNAFDRSWKWRSVFTVWHREPGGRDSGDVCPHYVRWTDSNGRRQFRSLHAWRWHVHHWKIQWHQGQQLRRKALTRCEWCRGRSRKGDPINVSHQWDRKIGPWWRGERGLFHHDCSSIATAHRTCICAEPLIEIQPWAYKMHADNPDKYPLHRPDHGKCETCGRFRAWGDKRPSAVEATRIQQSVPEGTRPTPEKAAEIKAAWAVFRTEEDAIREAERIVEDAHHG